MTNRELVETYPFLIPRNVWTDEIIDNEDEFTVLDMMPEGWRKAFGEQMCAEIKDALTESELRDYRVTQIKEKFGTLRWYGNFYTEPLRDILARYEEKSMWTCIQCGAPATRVTTGWIAPYCDACVGDRLSMPAEEWWTEWNAE